jgi:hypothetical protein
MKQFEAKVLKKKKTSHSPVSIFFSHSQPSATLFAAP